MKPITILTQEQYNSFNKEDLEILSRTYQIFVDCSLSSRVCHLSLNKNLFSKEK